MRMLPGVVAGYYFRQYKHKLPCFVTLRSSELDEVLVPRSHTQQVQAKAAADGKQRIAISASTTQSLESSAGVCWRLVLMTDIWKA